MARNKIDINVEREVREVAIAYGISAAHPLARTVAILRLLGFGVRGTGEGYARVYEKNFGIDNGPHIWIESPKASQLEGIALAQANLRERARLIYLLDEFYSKRTTTIWTRLIVQNMPAGGSLLNCQGAEAMGLPENQEVWDGWFKKAESEMTAFTEFLYGNLKAQPFFRPHSGG